MKLFIKKKGGTIESICHNKCGIIKPGVPVVIGPTVPRSIVEEYAKKHECEIIEGFDNINNITNNNDITYNLENTKIAETVMDLIIKNKINNNNNDRE